jgi:hypothetical protein
MFVSARRERNGKVQYCICQSWGPKTPSGPTTDDQPPFSFWADGHVVARMIAAEDSLAFSKFEGFVPRPVPARWTYAGFGDFLATSATLPRTDSRSLVDRLTPEVRAALEARKPEILAKAGSLPRREAIKLAWPTLLNEVPTMLRTAIDLIKRELESAPPTSPAVPSPQTPPLRLSPAPAPAPERRPTAVPEPLPPVAPSRPVPSDGRRRAA